MDTRIFSTLAAVRRRQRWQFALQVGVYGLGGSAAAGILLGVWRLLSGQPISLGIVLAVLFAGPILGMLVGLAWRRNWSAAAAAVDASYRLKDRTVTAVQFLQQPEATPLEALQICDAEEHLAQVEAVKVVPIRWPREWPYAVASLCLAVGLLVWPQKSQELRAGLPTPHAGIVAIAEEIEEDLDELEEIAEEEQSEELKLLVAELREQAEEMKQPKVDVREALAKISEMQAAIAEQQAQYNEALVDAQLEALGGAMLAAEALTAAGQSLQAGQFETAAQKLEKLEKVELEERDAKAAAEQLKKVARSMEEAGLGQLSGTVSETADGLGDCHSGKICQGAKKLARLLRRHDVRRKINKILSAESDKLSVCKAACAACAGTCRLCGGSCQGGQCQGMGRKNSLAEGANPQVRKNPTQSWGKGTSGAVYGDQTKLASQRELLEITGEMGDGPSEIETSNSPEGREQAQRGYREVYQEYRKLSEAVLESEPIPLGHRQTIRRYFELIRPEQGEPGTEE